MRRFFLPFMALMSMLFISAECQDPVQSLIWYSDDPMSLVIDGVSYKTKNQVMHSLLGAPHYQYFIYEEDTPEGRKDIWYLNLHSRAVYSENGTCFVVDMYLIGEGLPEQRKYDELLEDITIEFLLISSQDGIDYQFHSREAWIEITDLEFIDEDCKVSAKFGFGGLDINTQKKIVVTGVFEDYSFVRDYKR